MPCAALSAGGLQPESSHPLLLRGLALLATGLMSSVLRAWCSLSGSSVRGRTVRGTWPSVEETVRLEKQTARAVLGRRSASPGNLRPARAGASPPQRLGLWGGEQRGCPGADTGPSRCARPGLEEVGRSRSSPGARGQEGCAPEGACPRPPATARERGLCASDFAVPASCGGVAGEGASESLPCACGPACPVQPGLGRSLRAGGVSAGAASPRGRGCRPRT